MSVTTVIAISEIKIITKLLRVNPVTYEFVICLEISGVTLPNLSYQKLIVNLVGCDFSNLIQ